MTLDTLTTERLRLRAWTEADAAAVLDTYSRDEVARWLGATPRPCLDLDDARGRIARWNALTDGPYGLWAVETPGIPDLEPQPCGSVLLVPLERSDGAPTDAVEVGWHLHPAAWGHGIATEGARALLDRARDAGLRQLHAVVYEGNAPSVAVCDRLGMRHLGPTDEWYGVTLLDHVVEL
jgi:RimJ/RimL family protein N-acetyltransferase